MRLPWPAVLGGVLVAALGAAGLIRGAVPQSAGAGPAPSSAGPVAVTGAYVVAPLPPTQTAAAYFTVYNTTGKADRLLSVESGAGAESVLHTVNPNGTMSLDPDGALIPAHGSLTLSVGKSHVMIEQLFGPLLPGQTVNLQLDFQNAGSLDVVAPVVKFGTTPTSGGLGEGHSVGSLKIRRTRTGRTGAESSLVRWQTLRPWLSTLVRLALGGIWIWAASSKIGSPRTFVQAVRAYDATPEWLSKAIGYGLPVLEMCVGILLVLGVGVRLMAAVSGLLFVVFLIGIIQAAARGIQLECGCFGGGGQTSQGTQYTLDILRDLGLLVLAVYLVLWSFSHVSIEEFLARNDNVEAPSAKRLRTDQGRRKYNAMLEERRKAARERVLWMNSSVGVVVLLVALIGVGVQANRAKIAGTLTATNAGQSSGVVFGKKAAATVDVYEDFQCPHCEEFESAVQKQLDADVRANKAQVRFHTMSFLDSSSNGNRYSSRAANAALCASDISVDEFVAYHNVLYGDYKGTKVQPAEGSNGRTNTDFQNYATSIGISGANLTTFLQCVDSEKHKALVEAITEHASAAGVNATPTIKVNGKSISPTLAAWNAAIAKALKKGPAPDPSTTPAPSPKPSPSPSSSSAPVTKPVTKPSTSTSASKKA